MFGVFVSYIRRYVLTSFLRVYAVYTIKFSSPIFGDMFLLAQALAKLKEEWQFSSPIFGDMFLLKDDNGNSVVSGRDLQFSSPIFGDMFLLKLVCILFLIIGQKFSSPIFGDMFLLECIA